MSIKLMQMVWENAPCRENSLLILLALADWANDDGVCWPSMQKLADKARVDRRSAQRIVRKLVTEHLVIIDEGGGRANQHKYTIQTAALCRPPEKGDFPGIERAALATERATLRTQKATLVSPDPLVDPSVIQPSIDPPYAGADFSAALKDFEQSRTRMKKPLTPEARRLLYKKLAVWPEHVATQALEDSVINRWQGVFEPKPTNGRIQPNGVRPLDAAERNAARYSENLEFISDLRRNGGRDHH